MKIMNLLKFLKVSSQANTTKGQKCQYNSKKKTSTLESTTHLSSVENESTSEEEDSSVIKQDNQYVIQKIDHFIEMVNDFALNENQH